MVGLSVGGPLHRQAPEYLSFINRGFLNITKDSKCTLFIEKYNSLSKKTMNEHIYCKLMKSLRERELFSVKMAVVVANAGTDNASPSIISTRLISPTQLHS